MYVEKRPGLLMIGAGAADDLSGTGVHSYSYLVSSQHELKRFMAHITTVLSGAATVQLKRRPGGLGVTAGEEVVGELILPDAASVGQVYYKDVQPVELEVGDELVFEVSAAATSGGAAYDLELCNDPEDPRENSDMVESA
jgi:hypothetical protein